MRYSWAVFTGDKFIEGFWTKEEAQNAVYSCVGEHIRKLVDGYWVKL